MSNPTFKNSPPDQSERERALDPGRSILVQAPAGSGKTDLLTRRFLCLLSEVEDPSQIVAITFTIAAAAEMRHRILTELEEAAASEASAPDEDKFSMDALARRALLHARALGWNLLDQPAQLRISTIDSFCRDLALQQPLLSGLGDGLGIYEQPEELYRRAARKTLEQLDNADSSLCEALEALLLWRDNNWQEMENLLIEMLQNRDRWMHGFVLEREQDWEALRERLERPFAQAVSSALTRLSLLLDQVPGATEEGIELARFACQQGVALHQGLAELVEFPNPPFTDSEDLEEARQAYAALATLVLTNDGGFRKAIDKRHGFPADRKGEKARLLELIDLLRTVPGLDSDLDAVRSLPPSRYSEDDWQIVRACFTVLRHSAGELKVAFAVAGAVDFTEVAQTALRVLKAEEGLPSDFALAAADGIRHILVDEFQDTSRRQHQLLAHLIAAWPEREGRTCFVVGDPMQSIYFFRDADAELFPRVGRVGLEIPNNEPLIFETVKLKANFRTAPPLVNQLNEVFERVFEVDDGSGVAFSSAIPARVELPLSVPEGVTAPHTSLNLHLKFLPQAKRSKPAEANMAESAEDPNKPRDDAKATQTAEIAALIRSHIEPMEQARAAGKKYRIAVLGRTRSALAGVAQALREASIPFRAVDLEQLSTRPEVLDAIGLARALLNPLDRVAWLGVLRAPWCGLSLDDLYLLVSANNSELLARPVPELLSERLSVLSEYGRAAARRVLRALDSAADLRFGQPAASLGTWLEQVWVRLDGADCVDATSRANLDLLWRSLDSLPNGEQDLLGPALTAALAKLTAQPDPEANSECGVQLMTIHKSKGLEFEVVIVPELQAGTGRSHGKLLSWLERGLPPEDCSEQPDGSEEVTEFLIAPLQPKGADRGKAKAWVDRVYRQREAQETRRILYVVATRARDELHIFARPNYKAEKDGSLILSEPGDSLLATAWPGLAAEIQQQFDEKVVNVAKLEAEPATIQSIAASGGSNLLVMPSPTRPTLLRRLPADYLPREGSEVIGRLPSRPGLVTEPMESPLYRRHEGGLLSRALGIAVHTLLEELARFRKTLDLEAARAALLQCEPRIAAQIRAAGVERFQATAAEAMCHALKATEDANGQWILSPHSDAASEVRWIGVVAGKLRTVQVDRVFRAGLTPRSEGGDAWWIIDYKTAYADDLDPEALLGLRAAFAPQLKAYAEILGNLHGHDAPIRAGLYYPRMLHLDWWEL